MAQKRRRYNRTILNIFRPTVGKLLVLLMAAYFVFTFVSISKRKVVNYYEVEEGSLVKEHSYTGLIIRSEEIVNSQAGGNIYFYVADGRKVAAGAPVYSIDEGGDLVNYLNTHTDELSNANSGKIKDIRTQLLSSSRSFSNSNFNTLYEISDSIEAKVVEYASLNIFNTISDDLKQAGINFQTFNAEKNGTLCCYVDGYETIDENNLSAELFDQSGYAEARKLIKAGSMIKAGDPAYKLITKENWTIAFQLTDEEAETMRNATVLKVKFSDKGFTAKLPFKVVYGTDGAQYGILTMSSYLVQFTGDRFINFEIITNDVSGLKIPDKAITEKNFYIIPEPYMDSDENGNTGFHKAVLSEGGTADLFVITDIYAIEDGYCYIECNEKSDLKPGDCVLLPRGHVLSDSDKTKDSANAGSGSNGTQEESSAFEPEYEEDETVSETEEPLDAAEAMAEDDAEDIGGRHDLNDDEDVDRSENNDEGSHMEETETSAKNDENSVSDSKAEESDTAIKESASTMPASVSTSSGELYQVGPMKALKGVYNINKGYTIFRRVEILESANGYSIVRRNSSYGLSTYDHIVLDTDQVEDDQLLYR